MGGFRVDATAMVDLAEQLRQKGWTGAADDLRRMLTQAHGDTALRQLVAHWQYGERAKKMVLSLIVGAQRRQAQVAIHENLDLGRGPTILLSFPEPGRRKAIQIQVQKGSVYVVRHIDGDWRSARTFRPAATSAMQGPELAHEA